MKITQVRNATIIVEYNNTKFLIDPWLMPKDYMPGFDTAINSEIRQPRVELPFEIEKILTLLLLLIFTLTTGMNLLKMLWIKI